MEEPLVEAVKNTWSVDPTTVFGVLVGILFIYGIWTTYQNFMLNKFMQKTIIDVTGTLKDHSSVLTAVKEAMNRNNDSLKVEVKNGNDNLEKAISVAQQHLSQQIQTLESRLR